MNYSILDYNPEARIIGGRVKVWLRHTDRWQTTVRGNMTTHSDLNVRFHDNGSHSNGIVHHTLADTLSYLLVEAEKEFGLRNLSFTLVDIEYEDPHRRAPDTRFSKWDNHHMFVVLGPLAKTDLNAAIFELSHEVVHLLSPKAATPASVLEEGAAVYFAEKMSARFNVTVS